MCMRACAFSQLHECGNVILLPMLSLERRDCYDEEGGLAFAGSLEILESSFAFFRVFCFFIIIVILDAVVFSIVRARLLREACGDT